MCFPVFYYFFLSSQFKGADEKKEPKGYSVNKLWSEKLSILAELSESIIPVSFAWKVTSI